MLTIAAHVHIPVGPGALVSSACAATIVPMMISAVFAFPPRHVASKVVSVPILMRMSPIVDNVAIGARMAKVAFLARARHNAVFACQPRHVVMMAIVSTLRMMPTIVVHVGINVRNKKVVGMEYARY